MSQFFAILTLQILFYKNVSVFFLETSISESVVNLKGRGVYFSLIVSKNMFFPIKYAYFG